MNGKDTKSVLKYDCKVFSNESLFLSSLREGVPRSWSELAKSSAMPLSAVILLNSPTIGEWDFKQYTRFCESHRSADVGRPSPTPTDTLPCYFICADGAYAALKDHWAAHPSSCMNRAIPNIVIGDMDSCDAKHLPNSACSGEEPRLHLYPTVDDIPLSLLRSIRQGAVGAPPTSPVFIRIECQMTTDFQKSVLLVKRLEEAFPLDFPRFVCAPAPSSGKGAAAFRHCSDGSLTVNAFQQRCAASCDELRRTIDEKSAGAWADSVSREAQAAERKRITDLLDEIGAGLTSGERAHFQYHLLPNIAAFGALGGRFDHEMSVMNTLLLHSRRYHIMVTSPYNIIAACWPDGATQWLTHNEQTRTTRAPEDCGCELSGGCGVIPMGTVLELETSGLLYNMVKGRPERCDAVTQTSGYHFGFDGLLSACNTVTDPVVVIDLRPLHHQLPVPNTETSVNPPTLLSCSRRV